MNKIKKKIIKAIELISLLMDYGVKEAIIKSLVNALKPPKKIEKPDSEESKIKRNKFL